MTEDLTLASEFPPTSDTEWRRLVDAALKGASFDKRLVSQTYDGLRIEPLYPRKANAVPVAGRAAAKPWIITQLVDHPDPKAANAQALDDLMNGATGLTVVFAGSLNSNGYGLDGSPETLARVFDGIELDAGITIDFNLSPPTRTAVNYFAALVKSRNLDASKIDFHASFNPLGGLAATGTSPRPWPELAQYFATMLRDLTGQGFRGPFAVADGRLIHNAGGSEAQELAFAIASAVEYMRVLEANGMPPAVTRDLISFRMAADADEFLTIAKFRSIRKLWARVEEACGLPPKPAYVAAETAWRMMTRRDPNVNMLRSTLAVAAAGLGGADSITALPHTAPLGLPDAFARRVARNTQLILLEESNLAKVADPAAGSGAIEDLTGKMCAAAWAMLQEIEAAGGAWAALEKGLVQSKVAAVRAERQKAIARRKDTLTGTSDYPNLTETSAKVLNVPKVKPPHEDFAPAHVEMLPRIRLAEPFEALRDASDRAIATSGSRPKVFLANLGTLSDFTARAMFAKNFYESGGIEAVSNDGFALSSPPPGGGRSTAAGGREGVTSSSSPSSNASSAHPGRFTADPPPPGEGKTDIAALLAAFKMSGAKLACLCSSDKIYAADAADAAKALKAAGAIVHLAGRPGDLEAALKDAGVTAYAYVGCDVLATLQAVHDSLGVR